MKTKMIKFLLKLPSSLRKSKYCTKKRNHPLTETTLEIIGYSSMTKGYLFLKSKFCFAVLSVQDVTCS